MLKVISITIADTVIEAVLNDSPTAQLVFDSLPLEGTVNVWGEEIYFIFPLKAELEAEARAEVEIGELGYWPSGPAFCIFFGPTPMSTSEKPHAYSPVNVFGRIQGDCSPLKSISDGAIIKVER